jgi:hypothetical protein
VSGITSCGSVSQASNPGELSRLAARHPVQRRSLALLAGVQAVAHAALLHEKGLALVGRSRAGPDGGKPESCQRKRKSHADVLPSSATNGA